MMKRITLVLTALLVISASGCSTSAPAPTAEPPAPPTQPAEPEPCRGPVTAGPPSISILTSGVMMPLPMSDCAIALPAGPVKLSLLINNLQEQAPVQVTGAPSGRWDGQQYQVDFNLAAGEVRRLTLDVGAYSARNPLTYTFTGDPAIDAVFASGPSRQGPWTAVSGEVVPPEHTWLRIQYPRPLQADSPSIITDDQYARPGAGLRGEWEGNRVQYVAIGDRKPVLYVQQTSDENGLQMYHQSVRRLYRGAPPELQRLTPATGDVKRVYLSTAIPWRLSYRDGRVLWWNGQEPIAIDPVTGAAQPATVPPDAPSHGLSFPSPDAKWAAELSYPDGPPGHPTEQKSRPVSLIIRESGSGKPLVQLDRGLTTWGSFSCTRGTPGLAWRPDGQALAFLDAPNEDRLVLKELDLRGVVRTVAEWSGAGVGLDQTAAEVHWAPSGKLLVVGPRLVEAATGRTLAEKLPEHAFWSPDSQYLLLYGPDHPFTPWGTIELLTVESGNRRDLGHGLGLGWTQQGEALLVRWDVSKEIPPPGKGCP
ncbi:MAG TPA: hypothetical protein VD969_23370 [Symbiobacteriaceae bacterium]|nr:hypothetical protein [Symbiobacteriaceae bacterium]